MAAAIIGSTFVRPVLICELLLDLRVVSLG